ncbi:hypothetical protein WU86_06035 [Corynebacterium xerosis]|nr:hypothetical protein WU86_06035 [Corynebacterium xerosis]
MSTAATTAMMKPWPISSATRMPMTANADRPMPSRTRNSTRKCCIRKEMDTVRIAAPMMTSRYCGSSTHTNG